MTDLTARGGRRRLAIRPACAAVALTLVACVTPQDALPEEADATPDGQGLVVDAGTTAGDVGPPAPDAPIADRSEGAAPGDAQTTGCGAEQRTCPGGTCAPMYGCCLDSECAVPNGSRACVNGQCGPVTCAAGWGDCMGAAAGCETDITTVQNCGQCSFICGKRQVCQTGRCTCLGTTCDTACTDLQSDPDACGHCGTTCPGACVSGRCQCTPPSPANLVANPSFDGLSAWTGQAATGDSISTTTADPFGCPGTALVASASDSIPGSGVWVEQCIRAGIVSGTTYTFGAWFRFDSPSPPRASFVSAEFYTTADCSDAGMNYHLAGFPSDTSPGVWQHAGDAAIAPDGTRSVRVRVGFGSKIDTQLSSSVLADMAYLTPAPGHWTADR